MGAKSCATSIHIHIWLSLLSFLTHARFEDNARPSKKGEKSDTMKFIPEMRVTNWPSFFPPEFLGESVLTGQEKKEGDMRNPVTSFRKL